jgi:hypothetical protein
MADLEGELAGEPGDVDCISELGLESFVGGGLPLCEIFDWPVSPLLRQAAGSATGLDLLSLGADFSLLFLMLSQGAQKFSGVKINFFH